MEKASNTWIILFKKCKHFLRVIHNTFLTIFFSQKIEKEEKEFTALGKIFHEGPESFWKKPSGIKLGRSFFSFIYSFISK